MHRPARSLNKKLIKLTHFFSKLKKTDRHLIAKIKLKIKVKRAKLTLYRPLKKENFKQKTKNCSKDNKIKRSKHRPKLFI